MPKHEPSTVRLKRRRRDRSTRERVGWVLAVVGVVLFVASNFGSRAGFTVLPFDQHHVIGQVAGVAFAWLGITLISRG